MDEVLFFDENNFDILDIDGYELCTDPKKLDNQFIRRI